MPHVAVFVLVLNSHGTSQNTPFRSRLWPSAASAQVLSCRSWNKRLSQEICGQSGKDPEG